MYRISEERAIVVTADFFTPIVDDPYDFGRIAAANALSDVYAMGGRALFGLNLVGFPRKLLSEGLLEEILRGGSDKTAEAGIPVLGGHTIDDAEPKFGMVAVGEVSPERMITNAGARAGDALVLTKPLGSGVVATAIKAGTAGAAIIAEAVEVMATLNRGPAEVASELGVVAGTDVTGFGLLGHLHRVLASSGVGAVLDPAAVPVMDGVTELVDAGHVPGGTRRNLADLAEAVSFADSVTERTRTILADAQTSGGLLLAVAPDRLEELVGRVREVAPVAAVIGEVVEGPPGTIRAG